MTQKPTAAQLLIAASEIERVPLSPGQNMGHQARKAVAAWLRSIADEPSAAVEADRRDHSEGVRGMVPSDEEIASWVYLGQTIVDPDDVLGEAGFVRLIRAALSRYGSSQPAELAKCVGCEGHPAPENNPCAVCGQPAASAEPNAEARRALEIASDLRKDFRDDTHNYDTMLGAATLLESFAATAAPVAQEPVGVVCRAGPMYYHGTTMAVFEAEKVPVGTKLYAAPVAAQAQPEDARQRVGQAISDFMATYADDDDSSHCPLDWCDSDNVDALRDAVLAAMPSAQPTAQNREDAPDRTGIYAWIDGSSVALVLIDKRPSAHSPGGTLNGHIIDSTRFYDGCAVEQWGAGRWVLLHDFDAARAAKGADHD